MATNIGTAAAFTTANMKPAPGEQIDAVWGQNIADNTGFVYHMDRLAVHGRLDLIPMTVASSTADKRGTWFFLTPPVPSYLKGTANIFKSDTTSDVMTGVLYVNGVAVHTLSRAAGTSNGTSGGFSYDISGLTANTIYPISYRLQTISTGQGYCADATFSAFVSHTP